mmetsp:Transcript_82750/g.237779  ORF Transcript_82750/g.237779 Transcript_82750/m.237779 type:complete len:111 (-) Transcript_82750:157-489(-)
MAATMHHMPAAMLAPAQALHATAPSASSSPSAAPCGDFRGLPSDFWASFYSRFRSPASTGLAHGGGSGLASGGGSGFVCGGTSGRPSGGFAGGVAAVASGLESPAKRRRL